MTITFRERKHEFQTCGHRKNGAGKSVVVSDGTSPREMALKHTPGFVSAPIWMTAAMPTLQATARIRCLFREQPATRPGGSVFLVVTFPPDSVMMSPDFNPALAGPEHVAAAPGIAETFEMDNPGMHTTPTWTMPA